MGRGIGTGFFRYAAGVHPYVYWNALVRELCDEYPYSNAISRIDRCVSLTWIVAPYSRLPAIYCRRVVPVV